MPSFLKKAAIIPALVESDSPKKDKQAQGSSSFLKKRTKKLLPIWGTT
jgi:hypothetical protein